MINDKYFDKNFFVKAFGCQYNEWDAVRTSQFLRGLGLIESTEKEAEIIIVLNCSVRKTGVDRAMGKIRNYIDDGKQVIISGCVLDADRKRFAKGVKFWDGDLGHLAEIVVRIVNRDFGDSRPSVLNDRSNLSSRAIPSNRESREIYAEISPPSSRSRNDKNDGSAGSRNDNGEDKPESRNNKADDGSGSLPTLPTGQAGGQAGSNNKIAMSTRKSGSPRNDNADVSIPDTKYSIPYTNFVPIMKGCNNFCAYCVVPYTRGREVSRPVEDIVKDVKKLIKNGEKEIWLLGQNVNSFVIPAKAGIYTNRNGSTDTSPLRFVGPEDDKKKDDKQSDFTFLLEKLNSLPGEFTIYFTSNHPKDMSDDIIDAIATLPKIGKTIHLPLQSGSDKILKAMNRPYTIEQYLNLVKSIKSKVPKVKITTDTIVGFPGETEEDFQETVDVFKKVNFYQSFNNKYSPREGTAAFCLGDPIPWSEKQRRWRVLNEFNIKPV